ncbi:unnamed protein product [Linum tenue]|uniref:Uncharacterized protein n=1 Tax=Linum tenue TaxID=586396 RepID=A0AAV0GTV6_9ROSI|nr:unnamed protein product [Linum tenue]
MNEKANVSKELNARHKKVFFIPYLVTFPVRSVAERICFLALASVDPLSQFLSDLSSDVWFGISLADL